MHCFFCRTIGRPGEITELDERDRKHLFKTLRAAVGDKLELTDGQGTFAVAEIRPNHSLAVLSNEVFAPPSRRVHLFLVPPKKQKMDILLKQCAETGVWSITTMFSARSVSMPEKDEVAERWQMLLQEGCKQAKNPFLPQVSGLPLPFEQAVAMIKKKQYRGYFGSPSGENGVPDLEGVTDVAWIVGPEGGFTPKEEEHMRECGIADLRIGRWVLRVETAAIGGCLLLQG